MTAGSGAGAPPGRPFPRDILAGDSLAAARALLGACVVRDPVSPAGGGPGQPGERRVGRIVEVEAYVGLEDRASHARMGPTARNRVMFGPPGIAYVYLVYGMHYCLNVVTEPAGRPAAVLIRAVEPLEGAGSMRRARAQGRHAHVRVPDVRLAAGPGLVAAAFGIDRSHSGLDLCDPASPIRLEVAPVGEAPVEIEATPRVGIAYAGEPWASVPWRFLLTGSRALSRGRAADPSRRRVAGPSRATGGSRPVAPRG